MDSSSDVNVSKFHQYNPQLELLYEKAKTNTEEFRAETIEALAKFSPKDRELCRHLANSKVGIENVLAVWESELLPERTRLEKLRSDAVFRSYLMKKLGFDSQETQDKIDALVVERIEQAVAVCLLELYPLPTDGTKDNDEEHRQTTAAFFAQTDEEIEDFRQRYYNYAQHMFVVEELNVAIYDPHASWLERQRCAKQIRKERQNTAEEEMIRLAEIDQQLAELASSHDGLLGKMVANKWDFATVMDLRHRYEKELASLDDAQKSPMKHLQKFEKVTKAFRERETEKLARQSSTTKLKAVRQISEEVEKLLIHIFDLENGEKNSLLLDMAAYRTLAQERDMLLAIQNNRTKFFEKTTG